MVREGAGVFHIWLADLLAHKVKQGLHLRQHRFGAGKNETIEAPILPVHPVSQVERFVMQPV